MSCRQCGGAVDATEAVCPHCGAPIGATQDRALLLPSGPTGAVIALLLAGLLFAGIWLGFDRATSAPAAAPASATSPSPTPPPEPSPSPVDSPSPTPPPPATPEPDPAAAWEPVLAMSAGAIVEVTGSGCDDTDQAGAGFLVAPGRVVTAAHLLTDAAVVQVRQGTELRQARVLGRDADLDLALLDLLQPLGTMSLELVERPVAIGQRVAPAARVGDLPEAVPATVSGISITVNTRRGRLAEVLRTDAAVEEQFAGGPVLTPTGRVAGMVLADHVVSAVGDLGFALPAARVATRLADWSTARPQRLARCPRPTPSPTPAPSATPTPTRAPQSAPSPKPRPSPSPPAAPRPAAEGWISILESMPTGRFDRADAIRRARAYAGAITERTRVLLSDDFRSLRPGYWVVWTGPHDDRDQARARCRRYGSATPVCYPRRLAR